MGVRRGSEGVRVSCGLPMCCVTTICLGFEYRQQVCSAFLSALYALLFLSTLHTFSLRKLCLILHFIPLRMFAFNTDRIALSVSSVQVPSPAG